jgi:hypothetical protein
MIFETKLPQFLSKIKQLDSPIQKSDVWKKDFLLETENKLTMYYAPHNEYINVHAKIVIVGITPGWSQMKAAYESVIQSINKVEEIPDTLHQAKFTAGFSGQIRNNLCTMLDQIGLSNMSSLSSVEQLFREKRDLLHTTSIIRYPVFTNEKNYTGYSPSLDQSALLTHYAYHIFPKELKQIHDAVLIIPLGRIVEKVIRKIMEKDTFHHHTCLFGFPHPSGANGHRKWQLQQNQQELQRTVGEWIRNQSE